MTTTGPYRGLAPFTESDEDAARFFGRDNDIRIIRANLVSARLTILYGPAGVGKSSLLRAGVTHRLRSDTTGGQPVAVAIVTAWDRDPTKSILQAAAVAAQSVGATVAPLPEGRPLDEALAEWNLGVRLLIVLDQFEEYCLYHERDALPFDHELPMAIERRDLDLHFLISIREDALAALDRYKGRVTDLFGNYVRLDNLSHESAMAAIRCPVEQYNEASGAERVTLEEGLEAAVLDEIAPGRVALASQGRGVAHGRGSGAATSGRVETPYLQLLMGALWEREAAAGSSVLRLETLRAMGGATAVVRAHVDGVVSRLSPAEQDVAADALHFLITPSGTKVAHSVADLADYADVDRARLGTVLERLCSGDARLLRRVAPDAGQAPRYEVFHDVLGPAILDWRARLVGRRLQRRLSGLLGVSVVLLVALAATIAYAVDPGWLHRLEHRTVDARATLGGPPIGRDDVTIVDIDQASIDPPGWPPDRRLHARIIDRLKADGAELIVYDIAFGIRSRTAADRGVQAAIARARGDIVLAADDFGQDERLRLFGRVRPGATAALLERLGAAAGYWGFPREEDGVYRLMETEIRLYPTSPREPTLAAAAARLAEMEVESGGGPRPIEYRDGRLRTVEASDLLAGRTAEAVQGKLVIVGTTLGEEPDIHPTPVGRMTGAEIHGHAYLSLIHDREPLRDLLIIGLLALLPVALVWTRPLRAVLGVLVIGAAYLVIAQLLFRSATILPVAVPIAALVLSGTGLLVVRTGLWQRQRRATPRGPSGAPPQAPDEETLPAAALPAR